MANGKKRLALLLSSVLLTSCSLSGNPSSTGSDSASSGSSDTTGSSNTSVSTSSGTGSISGTYKESSSSSVTFTSTNLGAGTATETLSGRYVITGDCVVDGGTWESTTGNQAVFLVVNGGSLTISNATINKSGTPSSVGDGQNFYGLNSAVVAAGSTAKITMENCTVNVTSAGSNAIFSGAGAAITVNETTIANTGSGNSRGLHATYGGSIIATYMDISTSGTNSASVATDRGGGDVTISGSESSPCTLKTTGNDSPCLYSTGTIIASYCEGSAESAQAMVIEGSNEIKVSNCTLTGKNRSSSYSCDWGAIMLYQSMSNDSVGGEPIVEIINSTITNSDSSSPMFYVTNALATVYLDNATLDNTSGNGEFLDTTTTRWTSTNETFKIYLISETLGNQTINLANSSTSKLYSYSYESSVSWTNTGSGSIKENTTLSSAPSLPL